MASGGSKGRGVSDESGGQHAEVLDKLLPGSSTGNGEGDGSTFFFRCQFLFLYSCEFFLLWSFHLSKLFAAWCYGGRRECGVAEKRELRVGWIWRPGTGKS